MFFNNEYILLEEKIENIAKIEVNIFKNREKKIEDIEIEGLPNILITINYDNIPNFNNIFSSVKIIITNNRCLYMNDNWLNIPENVEYIIVKENKTIIYRNNRDKFDFIDVILKKYSSYYNDQIIIKHNLIINFIKEIIREEREDKINKRNIQKLSLIDLLIIHTNNIINEETKEICKELMNKISKKIINENDYENNSLLHQAIIYNKYEIADIIVENEKYENFNGRNNEEEIILEMLIKRLYYDNKEKIINLIYKIIKKSNIKELNKNYKNNYKYNGESLILIMIGNILKYFDKYDRIIDEIIEILITETDKIIINKEGYFNNTILHYYGMYNYKNKENIERTINNMSIEKIIFKNIENNTAYDIACKYKNNILIDKIYEKIM
jgi:hypothetical protein